MSFINSWQAEYLAVLLKQTNFNA